MSIKQPEPSIPGIGQSPGCDPRTSKRSSGLFSFFKWFRPSTSHESVTQESCSSASNSCDSLNSIESTGTIASFSYVPPADYKTEVPERSIVPGPETDTYKARLRQRDKRREHDKNITLRKKYNLFFNRDTVLKSTAGIEEGDNSKSLPLMTRKGMEEEEKSHRRTNSESSKLKRAGAYCHVKGKRRAPQPPVAGKSDGSSTTSLRRKKRLAPQPPTSVTPEKVLTSLENVDNIEYADADVIFNDSLKLEHGILKSAKPTEVPSKSPRGSYVEAPVSPRPWYKRSLNKDSATSSKSEHKDDGYEPIETQFSRHSTIPALDEQPKQTKKKEDKRKSGISFLTNISQLDREASEIIKKEHQNDLDEPPPFMRPKENPKNSCDSWVSPKRKSARDLIAKFNAITNVTKVTVNSAFFGTPKESSAPQKEVKRDYFGKTDESNTKKIPLMKSESAVIKPSSSSAKETPKFDRKSWFCPKCSLENDYWRIICYVCSTIKPYFDDLTTPPTKNNTLEKNKTQNSEIKHFPACTSSDYTKNNSQVKPASDTQFDLRQLERSKTQIGFSALARYNESQSNKNKFIKSVSVDENKRAQPNNSNDKQEEKERLKKMLIEMKNSLPKRKFNAEKQASRTSVIQEDIDEAKETSGSRKVTENLKGSTDKSKNATNKLNQPMPKLTQGADKVSQAKDKSKEPDKTVQSTNKSKQPADEQDQPTNGLNQSSDAHNRPPDKLNQPPDQHNRPPDKAKSSDKTKSSPNKSLDESPDKPNDLTKGNDLNQTTEIIVATKETIYENIKVKKTDQPKPIKISTSAQTNALAGKPTFIPGISGAIEKQEEKRNFELMRPKDFANIYNVKTDKPDQHIYANLMENGNLFLNIPMAFNEIKNNTDTIEINRLLRRLETAIAKGELSQASNLARELAQLKVNCSVVRQKSIEEQDKPGFMVEMYVEDRISHRGPFPIKVSHDQTVAQLKNQVEKAFQIPVDVQRWILGKELASDDNSTLKDHKITTEGCPIFLYLVAPVNGNKPDKEATPKSETNANLSNSNASTSGNDVLQGREQKTQNDIATKVQNVQEKRQSTQKQALQRNHELVQQNQQTVIQPSQQNQIIIQFPLQNHQTTSQTVQSKVKSSQPEIRISQAGIKSAQQNEQESAALQQNQKVIPEPARQNQAIANPSHQNQKTVVQHSSQSHQIQREGVIQKQQPVVQKTPSTPVLKKETITIDVIENSKSKIDSTPQNIHVNSVNLQLSSASSTSKTNHVNPTTSNPQPSGAAVTRSSPKKTEEYDSKTLKPDNKTWECIMCTFLNQQSNNVCAICATVRRMSSPNKTNLTRTKRRAPQPTYQQLLNLDNADLVENVEAFECLICLMEIAPSKGVTLRECLHQFCKPCLAYTIEFSDEAEVKCPYRDDEYSCELPLQDREIKALVTPVIYDQFLAKSITQAENKIDKSFHCKTPDCKGWCIFEDNVNDFHCPVCRKTNCLTCQAIHMGMNCKQYQETINDSPTDENAKRTKEMLEEMVNKGEAIKCPTCQVILMKKWGCDWLRCSMCKTEICWVTRGPRWGPAGKGDTSGGCQCGVNGVKCHPQCNYCH